MINNNTKSRFVAQYLSEDEIIENYEWFLDCLLQATNNNPPICLFSDADPALINTIMSKLPRTHHFFVSFTYKKIYEKNEQGN